MNINTSYPKNKINILLLENISSNAVDEFKSEGYLNVKKISAALDEEELIDAIKEVHLLGIRSKTNITKNVLDHAQKLLAIGCYCIGTNQVNLIDATQKGVAVFNSPFPNTRSVAELVIASAIMLLRKIPLKNKAAHDDIWLKDAKNCFELRGKTLGIIGYGNIGMQVSVMAEALGMQVMYFDIDSKLTIGNAKQVHTLKELLQHADVITLHVPEETSTQQLINRDAMLQMKKGSILINFARGTVVDLIALKEMIETNHIGGAAIDVFPDEPEKNGDAFYSQLQNLPNILLTPHIGGSTEEAQLNISDDVTNKLLNFLEQGITSGSHTIPALNLPPHPDAHRILHIHKNVPGVLSEITNLLAAEKINILGQYLKTNQEIGYVVLDVSTAISKTMIASLKMVTNTIKMRVVY